MSVLYLFSGAQRKSSVTSVLQHLCHQQGIHCTVHEVDIQNSPEWDLSKGAVQQPLLQRIKQGEFDAVLVTPPCSTWSRVRGANCRGPPAIRSREHPWGFPWLSARHLKDAELGNVLIVFMLDVLETLEAHPHAASGRLVIVFGEHPGDLGLIRREEDGMLMEPASIWQLPRMRALVRQDATLELFTVVFNQCCWGAPYRKPTRLITNLAALRTWGQCQWPQFDAHRHYVGPILACRCKPTVTLARAKEDTSFRTSTTSTYPAAMDEQLAQSILQQWQRAPLQPAKEGERHPIGEEPGKEQHCKRHAEGKIKESPRKKAKPSKEKIEETPDKRVRPAEGPPIQVSYKGETRALHDGAGLCSPGRWPVDRRRLPVTEREKSTVAWFEDAFETWLKEVGVEEAKQIFWSMAAGRVKQSPFEKGIDEARRALDQHLARWGLEPCRIAEDRPSEINFRRLRALAEALSDEDFGFLEEVAARGVRLGVDLEMPRTPAVYEEKVKWTVDATDEIMRDMLAENYESAEENAEDIARQVLHEVEIGAIVRMMEHEARRKYKGRLAVAALGAVPKELGTKKVRLIHDGTYSVDVNRRIRVRDRMRFPLIDDATAVLRQVEHELDGSQGAIRFSVLYDIARAHKLIPVDEEDWGLQAFRLPGDKSGDIFVRARGTFGVASAAYWFGRAISVAVRCVHRLLGRRYGLLHLIYADDGWLTATGREFWKKILMWFFTFELLEIPVTWSKVRGGTEVNWIGYCLNVHTFQKGINQSKRTWIVDWIDRKEEQGGVLGRELKSVLGRLSFVAGALRHVRPFLAPLFSWASTMAPGTFSKFPDAVMILLDFIREEVKRKPMRRAEPLERCPVDIFRVDAKAAGEDIVIGGWETGMTPDQKTARWFSFRLNRKNAPWAYLKGDPFRNIATLELIGVLVAVMMFGPEAGWTTGSAAVTLTALTDNLGNTHVLKRYGSSKYPLSIVAMELAVQLDMLGIDMQLQWVPRAQNQPADDLTNDQFDDFDPSNRLTVDFEALPFQVMNRLLKKAGELDAELKLFRTSKEAKLAQLQGTSSTKVGKAKKGELRWRDPW